ncbi:MAG: HicB like antitoxin of bacterial toxin-antitoxin system [Gammaproteobacteria bacterium]|jgi:predicted RNase H-like HicB family nuclease|nr:HicB like antitoxin of bacterial toxin-antitoxin system [Gammaproteobacteria bacterium]
MLRNLTAVFEPAEEGGYVCWFEEIPEAMSQGETVDEAKANLINALREIIKYRREQAAQKIEYTNHQIGNKKIQEISISV